MPKKSVKKITYPSITEWIKRISLPNSELFINEDRTKYERLKILHKVINLPYLPPTEFTSKEILEQSKSFKKFFNKKKNNLCTLRLTPLIPELSKIRKRGGSLADNIKWYLKQKIDHSSYKLEVVPRSNNVLWSGIFVADHHGILGEMNKSGITQMVKGDHTQTPTIFSYNFKDWKFSKNNKRIQKIIKKVINKIQIKNPIKREKIKNDLQTEFTKNNFMRGYFEFTIWPKLGLRFVDYNRFHINIQKEKDAWEKNKEKKMIGVCAGVGKAIGKAKIILNPNKNNKFKKGDILVCKNINIDYLPIIGLASGIITEKGALLSHAAVICRELKKPYIVLVKNATTKIKNNEKIKMDANTGSILKI